MFLSTESNVEAINEEIPLLELDNSASLAVNIGVLQEYFQFYGYEKIAASSDIEHYAGIFESAGARIFSNVWRQRDAEHSVLVVHGLFDHTGLFLHIIDAFLAEGLNVIALDLPGHGLSQGERASIDDFQQYGWALKDFLQVLPESLTCSLSMLGQSTGCAAIMSYLQQGDAELNSIIYLAPLVRPTHWQKINLAYWVCKYCMRRVARRFTPSSHDPEFTFFLENIDGLQHPYIEIKWIEALRKWVSEFSHLSECNIPTLILQGTGDSTVDWQYNISQIKNKYPKLEVKYLESAKHHLANESESFRPQMLTMCTHFLRSHITE